MVYGSIPTVRSLAGVNFSYAHNVKLIGTPDGSRVEFGLPMAGERVSYLVDKDATDTSTITTADITVYVDSTPVTVSSIDQDAGTVILATPPALNTKVTADYVHAKVSDADILTAMAIGTAMADKVVRGSNTTGNTYTQTIDADGIHNVFLFDHYDVTSVDSVTVDGTTMTVDDDYYLEKHEGTSFYSLIKFNVTPSAKLNSIVITYTYGSVDVLITSLAEHYAARHVIRTYLTPENRRTRFVRGEDEVRSSDRSKLSTVNKGIIELLEFIDRRKSGGVI